MNINVVLQLVESINQYLYHSTTIGCAAGIMSKREIEINAPVFGRSIRPVPQYICLTRDPSLLFAQNHGKYPCFVQFKINKNILMRTHKLRPFSFFGNLTQKERRDSLRYGGFYKPKQWQPYEFDDSDDIMLNRMESEEFADKNIPITKDIVTEIQCFITKEVMYSDVYLLRSITNIKNEANKLKIPCNLYDANTHKRLHESEWYHIINLPSK